MVRRQQPISSLPAFIELHSHVNFGVNVVFTCYNFFVSPLQKTEKCFPLPLDMLAVPLYFVLLL